MFEVENTHKLALIYHLDVTYAQKESDSGTGPFRLILTMAEKLEAEDSEQRQQRLRTYISSLSEKFDPTSGP